MILGLDLGITTGWSKIEDDGSFVEWGEVRSIGSHPFLGIVREDLKQIEGTYRLVIAEVPLIVGVSILGRDLQAVIRHFVKVWPGMVTIGSGVWKTSNVTKLTLPDGKRSPHMRDAFYVANYGLRRYCETAEDRS